MSADTVQRRAVLLERCAAQRERICSELRSIDGQLEGVQRGIRIAQGLTTLPGVLLAGSVLAMFVTSGRVRTVRMLSTGLALWAALRRFRPGRERPAGLLADTDR
jgi:hypothetical protein